MAETERIIFTDASGKKIYIPVTHTDVIQYKDGILTSYLDNISTMSDTSYLMAYTAYENVSIAYNISKTSYNKVENLLKTDILAGNRYIGMKLISRIYDDGTGKLKADLIDNSAAWIKYDDTRSLIDEITYLNNKINNVQINNIESGDGININTDTGDTVISVKSSNATIEVTPNGVGVGTVSASKISYIYTNDKNEPISSNVQKEISSLYGYIANESDIRRSIDNSLIDRIDAINAYGNVGFGIVINNSNVVYPDDNNISYIGIAANDIYLGREFKPVLSYTITYLDDVTTLIEKIDAHINTVENIKNNEALSFEASHNFAANVTTYDIIYDMIN